MSSLEVTFEVGEAAPGILGIPFTSPPDLAPTADTDASEAGLGATHGGLIDGIVFSPRLGSP